MYLVLSETASSGSTNATPVDSIKLKPKKLEKLLCDDEYERFYSQFSKDQMKNFHFFEDIPGLSARNALKLNKCGDRNNACFDSVHFKQLSKYNLKLSDQKPSLSSSTGKKLSRKQIRRLQIQSANKRRYFAQIKNVQTETSIQVSRSDTGSTLTNRMWLYLEMTRQDQQPANESTTFIEKTADYMKYLNEHKHDVSKWLEFIDYQSSNAEITSPGALYERKLSIFEKAIGENASNFRLRLELAKFKAVSYGNVNALGSYDAIEREFYLVLGSESIKLTPKALDQNDTKQIVLNLFETWFELIKFSSQHGHSVNAHKRLYVKCVSFFLTNTNENMTKSTKREFFLINLLKIIDDYARFINSCGYVEKCVALYQALIEFNSSTSSKQYPNVSAESRKSLFELYWDIGLPKLGEKHAQTGWLECLENREGLFKRLEEDESMGCESGPRYEDLLDVVEAQILACREVRIEHRWSKIERVRSLAYWYPFYPRTVVGETADDCCDPDRLVSFDDDIRPFLIDLTQVDATSHLLDDLMFRLMVNFLKILNVIEVDENCLDLSALGNTFDWSTTQNGMSTFLARTYDSQLLNGEAFPFLYNDTCYLKLLFDSLCDETIDSRLTKRLIKNYVDFVRNLMNQYLNRCKSVKYKTFMTILKWHFELKLIDLQKSLSGKSTCQDTDLDWKKAKENLINQTRIDLSTEANRSNFNLWKEYAILKLLLNSLSNVKNLKETRKVFDTLLTTSESSSQTHIQACIDIYSLCVDYVQIELGIFTRPFEVTTTSHQSHIGTNVCLSTSLMWLESKPSPVNNKEQLAKILADNCLNKTTKAKSSKSSTFKIEMTGSTRLLLLKRDFQLEYEQKLAEKRTDLVVQKAAFLYHQVYSLFLVLIGDNEKFIQLNENAIRERTFGPYDSQLAEFYLNILNYSHYVDNKLDKFKYKTKLIDLIKERILSRSKTLASNSDSFMRLLSASLVHFKLDQSSALVNQLIEASDLDALFEQIARKFPNSDFMLTNLYANLARFDKVLKANFKLTDFKSLSSPEANVSLSNFGFHNQNRRLIEAYLRLNQKSLALWMFYFHFEIGYSVLQNGSANLQKSRLTSVYYQSIRSLPFSKILYLEAVNCVPEKYNEIMNVMYSREFRVYLPIQELNILLEPIKNPGDLNMFDDQDDTDDDESMNSSSTTSDAESSTIQDQSDQEDKEDEDLTEFDSQSDSNLSVDDLDLKNF